MRRRLFTFATDISEFTQLRIIKKLPHPVNLKGMEKLLAWFISRRLRLEKRFFGLHSTGVVASPVWKLSAFEAGSRRVHWKQL